LALNPYHVEARRRLSALEHGDATPAFQIAQPEKAAAVIPPNPPTFLAPDVVVPKKRDTETLPAITKAEMKPLKRARQRRKRGTWFYVGLLSAVLLSLASSYFVLTLLGSPIPGTVLGIFTGERPVTEIDGVPLEEVEDAVLIIEPADTKSLRRGSPLSDALSAGVSHEYEFEVFRGEEVAIAVQFFSPTAQNVPRNVAIFDADGRDATHRCQRETIIDGSSGAAFVCQVHVAGYWRVRILGRNNESTGAYIVTLERFS
jgi:hypothetical protein